MQRSPRMVCQQRRHWKELALCMQPNENKIDMDKDKDFNLTRIQTIIPEIPAIRRVKTIIGQVFSIRD